MKYHAITQSHRDFVNCFTTSILKPLRIGPIIGNRPFLETARFDSKALCFPLLVLSSVAVYLDTASTLPPKLVSYSRITSTKHRLELHFFRNSFGFRSKKKTRKKVWLKTAGLRIGSQPHTWRQVNEAKTKSSGVIDVVVDEVAVW